jgi:hypothetical protein
MKKKKFIAFYDDKGTLLTLIKKSKIDAISPGGEYMDDNSSSTIHVNGSTLHVNINIDVKTVCKYIFGDSFMSEFDQEFRNRKKLS